MPPWVKLGFLLACLVACHIVTTVYMFEYKGPSHNRANGYIGLPNNLKPFSRTSEHGIAYHQSFPEVFENLVCDPFRLHEQCHVLVQSLDKETAAPILEPLTYALVGALRQGIGNNQDDIVELMNSRWIEWSWQGIAFVFVLMSVIVSVYQSIYHRHYPEFSKLSVYLLWASVAFFAGLASGALLTIHPSKTLKGIDTVAFVKLHDFECSSIALDPTHICDVVVKDQHVLFSFVSQVRTLLTIADRVGSIGQFRGWVISYTVLWLFCVVASLTFTILFATCTTNTQRRANDNDDNEQQSNSQETVSLTKPSVP